MPPKHDVDMTLIMALLKEVLQKTEVGGSLNTEIARLAEHTRDDVKGIYDANTAVLERLTRAEVRLEQCEDKLLTARKHGWELVWNILGPLIGAGLAWLGMSHSSP